MKVEVSKEQKKYIPELDHYLAGINYHMYCEHDIDKNLLAVVPPEKKEIFLKNEKNMYKEAMGYQIIEGKYDVCTVSMDSIAEDGVSVFRMNTDMWIFSADELRQFIKEVREEVR